MNRFILKYKWPVFFSFTIPLLAYLFWPLESDEFAIVYDQAKIEEKQSFLSRGKKSGSKEPGPNIILLVADDLGQTDISLYGNELVQTPNIDRLGNEGVSFSSAYVTSSVCSPSRAGLLTGRYQHRFGFENQMQERYLRNKLEYLGMSWFINSDPWIINNMESVPREEDRIRQGLPPGEITIAEILKKEGYSTGLIGKWHLGQSEASNPCQFGFDYQYGFYGSHSLYAPEGTPGIVDTKIEGDWTDPFIWSGQRDGVHAMYRNCEEIQEPEYLTNRFGEEAINFILENQDNPFFLYVPFNAPHTPLQVPEEYHARFSHISDPVKRTYNAMIASLDDAVGNIVNTIDSLGLAENTLIFFISDNGGATYTLTTDNFPWKGGKITSFDGGFKVPFLIRWKGKIQPGTRYDQPVSSLDILATTSSAAELELPDDHTLDGIDLLPFLNGDRVDVPHQSLFWKRGAINTVLDGHWKLIFDNKFGQNLLYNLKNDPTENQNLAHKNPRKVEQLKKLHQNWVDQMPPPMWPPLITFRYQEGNSEYFFEN